MRMRVLKYFTVICLCLGLASVCIAQDISTTPATQAPGQATPAGQPNQASGPTLPPTPSITGPLKPAAPKTFDAGPFGKLDIHGIVSGMGLWQINHVPGEEPTRTDLSNGQIFLQKTTSWWQFYMQAGAYNIPALGTPFLHTDRTISESYGPVPVAFLKVVPSKNTSILMGALPTLMGAEYTLTLENMNIERGLLWNQAKATNRF
jgi:hypothetical protein